VRSLADLDPAVSQEVLRVVAEALENVHRHAGARRVVVDLDGAGDAVSVRVGDDGTGFDPAAVPARRFGVVGMRERAEGLGGTLDVHSTRGEGTLVTLRIPLPVGTDVAPQPHDDARQELPA
jgi:signal transduction histidine kinase